MFNNKRRIDAAFAKGLMFGKAVGARDERERLIKLLEDELPQFTERNPGHPVEAEAHGLRWGLRVIKGDDDE